MNNAVYRGLDYLENTTGLGEAFDLGVTIDNTIEFDIKYSLTQVFDLYTAIIGARHYPQFKGFLYYPRYSTDSKVGFQLSSSVTGNFTHILNNPYRALLKDKYFNLYDTSNGSVLKVRYNLTKYLTSSYSYNFNMYLFAGNSYNNENGNNEIIDPSIMKLYYCKVYKQGILVRDLIPVIRIEDNSYGLFDKVSKQFMTPISGNTENFTGKENNNYYNKDGRQLSDIVQRLEYAIETKELIREKLNEKGCNISESDSFRSYVDKIDDIEIGGNPAETYDTISVGGNSAAISFGYGYAGMTSMGIDFTDDLVNGYDENRTSVNLQNGSIIELRTSEDEFVEALINISQDENIPEELRFTNYIGLTPENIVKGNTILGVEGAAEATNARITSGIYLFYKKNRADYVDEILKLCDWNKFEDTSYMFYGCSDLTELDTSNFDTSNVTNMAQMFYSCSGLTELDLSNFDTSNVTSMNSMFYGCSALTELDLSNFDTSNVTNMYSMFKYCNNLTELDVSNFNTSNVTTMYGMFDACNNLTELDISNFDFEKVTNINFIFDFNYDSKITNIKFGKNLGKGYTQKSANNASYRLDITYVRKLTHDSLMSIINNLYDLNLTYDVANGGTLYTQQLVLGTTNMAKLTAEEIAIATNKGWTVS